MPQRCALRGVSTGTFGEPGGGLALHCRALVSIGALSCFSLALASYGGACAARGMQCRLSWPPFVRAPLLEVPLGLPIGRALLCQRATGLAFAPGRNASRCRAAVAISYEVCWLARTAERSGVAHFSARLTLCRFA